MTIFTFYITFIIICFWTLVMIPLINIDLAMRLSMWAKDMERRIRDHELDREAEERNKRHDRD